MRHGRGLKIQVELVALEPSSFEEELYCIEIYADDYCRKA